MFPEDDDDGTPEDAAQGSGTPASGFAGRRGSARLSIRGGLALAARMHDNARLSREPPGSSMAAMMAMGLGGAAVFDAPGGGLDHASGGMSGGGSAGAGSRAAGPRHAVVGAAAAAALGRDSVAGGASGGSTKDVRPFALVRTKAGAAAQVVAADTDSGGDSGRASIGAAGVQQGSGAAQIIGFAGLPVNRRKSALAQRMERRAAEGAAGVENRLARAIMESVAADRDRDAAAAASGTSPLGAAGAPRRQ
jgi:hypothetical protein